MDWFMYILFIIIVACMLLIWYIVTYNRFQNLIIRINEAEANIDSVLRKRFDLLNRSIGIIKANTDVKTEVLEIIVKLRSRKLTNFELDRQLYEAINEFNHYREAYPDLKKCDNFIKIEVSLNESETEIIAIRKYYNDIITEYNKLVKIFPSNIVAKLSKYSHKPYFDGKDMYDEVVNDFKL